MSHYGSTNATYEEPDGEQAEPPRFEGARFDALLGLRSAQDASLYVLQLRQIQRKGDA